MKKRYSEEDRQIFIAIAANIRRYRQQEQLTQENLAKRLGILPSAYNRLENGRGAYSVVQLVKLSQYLQIPIQKFFT